MLIILYQKGFINAEIPTFRPYIPYFLFEFIVSYHIYFRCIPYFTIYF